MDMTVELVFAIALVFELLLGIARMEPLIVRSSGRKELFNIWNLGKDN